MLVASPGAHCRINNRAVDPLLIVTSVCNAHTGANMPKRQPDDFMLMGAVTPCSLVCCYEEGGVFCIP